MRRIANTPNSNDRSPTPRPQDGPMLADLHTALTELLYQKGQIPVEDVDVRFDAPRRTWVSSLTRPTLDLFLFDVRENTDLRQANLQSNRGNGKATYRVPPRRFD